MDRDIIFDETYMNIAIQISKLSYCERLKVGAIIVKDNKIISFGYNGTPSGDDNCCEDINGVTKKEVLHSESNCLIKITKGHDSSEGASLYCTMSPCFDCAKLIYQSGIIKLYYLNTYRDLAGLQFLQSHKVQIKQIRL